MEAFGCPLMALPRFPVSGKRVGAGASRAKCEEVHVSQHVRYTPLKSVSKTQANGSFSHRVRRGTQENSDDTDGVKTSSHISFQVVRLDQRM